MPKKWFADPQLMSTTFSVSHVCNNLSKHEDILAYAHINDVIYVNSADTPYQVHKLPITDKFYVHQTRVCNLHSSTFIVVATESGIQIFDEKGEQSLYSFFLKDENVTAEEGRALFCRGICVVHSETPSIAVGSSVGNVFVLGTSQSAKASSASDHEFELLQTLGDSRDAIQCLDGSQHGALLAASDDSGSVVVRNGDDSFSIVHTIPAAGGDAFPVTSLRFTDDGLLVCAYVTGLLRIYKKGNFRLHAEIAAHTRAITALDVCEQFIVSVGEDTFMNVWETSGSASAPRVKLVSSQCVANDLLNGVVFVERNSARKSILTSSFDTTHLKLWQQE